MEPAVSLPIMTLTRIALVSAAVLALAVVGCKNDSEDDKNGGTGSGDNGATLGTNEEQLVEDDSEASGTDDDLEVSVDEPLSGGTPLDPGNPADGASDDEVLEKIRVNAGRFFKLGCLVSTRTGNKIAHVFNDCTGPYGLAHFDGTINATYVRTAGSLTVTLDTTGFTANGASISGSRVIVYTRNGSVITKTRTGNWSGSSEKGKTLTHTANFVTTYDDSTKCLTRDGTADSTIGGRSFHRDIENYKRCGIGKLGCPEAGGSITLTRTNKADDTATVSLDFLGGTKYEITRPSGKTVDRVLICNPNAS